MKSKPLFQILAPHFCAGGEISNGKVTICAPIIKYMKGWPLSDVIKYCTQKGWTFRSQDL